MPSFIRRFFIFAAFISLIVPANAQSLDSRASAQDSASTPGFSYSWNKAYYVYPELNAGLTALEKEINLATPQSCLENFVLSCEKGDYGRAAHSLNLNLINAEKQARKGPELAEKLNYVIKQRIWVHWDDVPDRPDAMDFNPPTGSNAKAGEPRRAISLGSVMIDGRDVRIGLQRIKTPGKMPVWVFSRQTVSNVPRLYENYGPGELHRFMPAFLKGRVLGNVMLWQWILMAFFAVVGAAGGWLSQKLAFLYLKSKKQITWSVRLASVIRLPGAIFSGLIIFYVLTFTFLRLTAPIYNTLNPLIFTLIIFDLTWLGVRVINFGLDLAKQSYLEKAERSIKEEEHAEARRVVTYFTIGRMVFLFIVFFIGLGVALSQFRVFQALGISLLASAGVASVIIGIAAQRVLGNILAGVQIAITQPVRIEDTVNFEGEWSNVEEINYTHLMLRTWDKRRIIVPISYFMTHTIENWSASKPSLVKPIFLYADYRLDVRLLRKKYEEFLTSHELWDENIDPIVQVTSCSEETMELRCLCSAKDASAAWKLHCELREAMIAWLQKLEDGKYLPRKRILHKPIENGGKTNPVKDDAEN